MSITTDVHPAHRRDRPTHVPELCQHARPTPKAADTQPSALAASGPAPRQHTHGLVGALNAEWRRLCADARARRTVVAWSETVPALHGLHDLPAVLTAVAADPDGQVLSGLLALAGDGDCLAARTALQVMLGAAVRLARRTRAHAAGDLDESIARAVAATWQVVRNYRVERRNCHPADGISLDVLAALTCDRRGHSEIAVGLPTDLADRAEPEFPDAGDLRVAFWSLMRPGRRPPCDDEQVIMLLAWGVRGGIVTITDARLLLRLHSPADPDDVVNCRDVAEEMGLGHAAVRQRASRATRRLAVAVQSLVAGQPLEHSVARRAA